MMTYTNYVNFLILCEIYVIIFIGVSRNGVPRFRDE